MFLVNLGQWDQPEDRLGLFGLGFAAVVGAWTATNLVTVIKKQSPLLINE